MKRPPKNLRFFFFYCARKCVRICIASIDKGEHACRRPKRWPAAFSALAGVSPPAACGLAGRLFAPTAGPSEFFGSEKEEMARRTRPPGRRPATRTTPPAPLFTPKNRVFPCQSMLPLAVLRSAHSPPCKGISAPCFPHVSNPFL